MKIKYTLSIAALAIAANASAQGWIPDTVSMGANYSNDVYYSFENGTVASPSNTNWHIAVEALNPLTDEHGGVGIWINEASKGEKVKLYPLHKQGSLDFATLSASDTVGLMNDEFSLHNSSITYADGAFNSTAGTIDPFDYGWGEYSMDPIDTFPAHSVVGDSVYLLITGTGGGMGQPMTQTGAYFVWPRSVVNGTEWTLFVKPVGSNETQMVTISTEMDQVFKYYHFTDGVLDREPSKADWNIDFTNYMDLYGGPETGGNASLQSVTGVLSNYNNPMAQLDNLVPNDVDTNNITQTFSNDINIIGFDWKVLNFETFSYDLTDSLSWFVKSGNGDIWQIYFDYFATDQVTQERKIGLQKRKVFTHPITGINQINQNINTIILAPNPSENDATNILVDAKKDLNNTQITITDISGRTVFTSVKNIKSGFQQLRLDVSAYAPGMYFVNIVGEGWKSTQKLVVR